MVSIIHRRATAVWMVGGAHCTDFSSRSSLIQATTAFVEG